MSDVELMGGRSTAHCIRILSNRFTATARFHKDGQITCVVTGHSPLSRFLSSHQRFPIPQLVRILLFLVDGMNTRERLLFVLFAVSAVPASSLFTFHSLSTVPLVLSFAAGIALQLGYGSRRVATWHGAEHMAIAAYQRNGSTDLETMRRESPVHEKCGGRILLPLLVGTTLAIATAKATGTNAVVLSLTTLEALLWVDSLKGWDRIPVARAASRILQKYITTRQPTDRELRTAQRALQELIKAHHAHSDDSTAQPPE